MLKKPITYVDYDGNKRTENFYFNLDEAEILELQMMYPGGMTAMINKMIEEQNGAQILATIKMVIKMAYGEKSADGKYFKKSAEMSEAFTHTKAYSVLLMELYGGGAAEFMSKIIPQIPDQPVANPQISIVEAK